MTAPTKEQMLDWLEDEIEFYPYHHPAYGMCKAIRDVIAKSETPGWMYFNPSNEEWEWCAVRPAEDESETIVAISKERFFERFPDHD